MRKITVLLLCTLTLFPTLTAGANEISLSGVDAKLTPLTGLVNLYVLVTDADGRIVENLKADDFIVRDAPAGENPADSDKRDKPGKIRAFSSGGARKDGITFMMLIDDSGSMYLEDERAVLARREALNFLESLGNSMDRVGLAIFGTHYRVLAGPRTDRASLIDKLAITAAPESEEAYTELYASIVESATSLNNEKGRRILILFSDGENYPYFQNKKEAHSEYGERIFQSSDALKALQQEGITLYAVRFGANRDEELAEIARATGGLVFDVNDEKELSGLYGAIRERVLAEYRLGYSPSLSGSDETSVLVELRDGSSSAVLNFPSGFVFGKPSSGKQALLSLIAIPFALLILFMLAGLWKKKPGEPATLERLRPVGGGEVTVALGSGKTLISPGVAGGATTILSESETSKSKSKVKAGAGDSGAAAGVGVAAGAAAGNPGEKNTDGKSNRKKDIPAEQASTLLVEKGKDGRWRIFSDEGVVVNNRKSESTVLEAGDVIKAGEELIVFDDGES